MAWDPSLHPRYPAGHVVNGTNIGGKFMPKGMQGTALWAQQVSAQVAKKSQPSTPKPPRVAKATKAAAPKVTVPKAVVPKASARSVRPSAKLPFGETPAQREVRVLGLIARNRNLDTEQTQRYRGRWKTARAKQHRAIIADLMKRHAAVPAQRKAILAGGLIGAGKTSTLQNGAGINTTDYISINSDVIKEEMAARGMIPQISGQSDLSPLDHSSLVQGESLHVADMWLAEAIKQGKNTIFDASLSATWPTQSRLQMFRNANYHTTGVFIDVPVDVSHRRSVARYGQAHLDWMAGRGQGGRPIPSGLILGQRSGNSSYNRANFDSMRSQFDAWQVYDNAGSAPKLIAKS